MCRNSMWVLVDRCRVFVFSGRNSVLSMLLMGVVVIGDIGMVLG